MAWPLHGYATMDTMQHGEFIARIEYDEDAGSFHGQVVNLPEVVDFWGDSVQELREEFRKSVETHATVCRDRGIEPSRPSSGPST